MTAETYRSTIKPGYSIDADGTVWRRPEEGEPMEVQDPHQRAAAFTWHDVDHLEREAEIDEDAAMARHLRSILDRHAGRTDDEGVEPGR